MNRIGLVVGKGGESHGSGTGILCEWKDKPDLGSVNPLKAISYYYHFDHHIAVSGLFGFLQCAGLVGLSRSL